MDIDAVFVVLAVNGSNIFAGTSTRPDLGNIHGKGIFRSTDDGANWISVGLGFTEPNITSLAIHGSTVFAGTDSSGIFLSIGNGTTWTAFNTGLPNPYVSSLALNDRYIYAGILGGLWRRPLSDVVVSVSPLRNIILSNYRLEQNYPNPFNSATNISFGLRSRSFVSLKIYDVIGREVATLVFEKLSAGNHTRRWDAEKLPSGVYFYCLKTESYSETKKLVLLK